jgi:hypothetical protein
MNRRGTYQCGCCHRDRLACVCLVHCPYGTLVIDTKAMESPDYEWRVFMLPATSTLQPGRRRVGIRAPSRGHPVDAWIAPREATDPADTNQRQKLPPSVTPPQVACPAPNPILQTLPPGFPLLPWDASLARYSICSVKETMPNRSVPFLVFGLGNNRTVNQVVTTLFIYINVPDEADRDCALGEGCRCNPTAAQFGALVQLSPTATFDRETRIPVVFHRYLVQPKFNFVLIQTDLLLVYRHEDRAYSSIEEVVQGFWGRFKRLKAEIPKEEAGRGSVSSPTTAKRPPSGKGLNANDGRREVTLETCAEFLALLPTLNFRFRLLKWSDFIRGIVNGLLLTTEEAFAVELDK